MARQIREEAYLREFAPGVETAADLIELKRKLTATISYDQSTLEKPRPLLRSSAVQTLTTGDGFCGENARAAIVLLKQRGVRAHRLYLQGPRWGHVAVEHRWRDQWLLFDAHSDPGVLLSDDQVARIRTDELGRFPNDYSGTNPWERAARFKALLRAPGSAADALRPPSALVSVLERPYLAKALAGFAVAGAALVARRRFA